MCPSRLPGDELFDLCDARGRSLRRTKPRALVHRDGDWHRSFHCWIVTSGRNRGSAILLQRRAPQKETWGNLWDVSVAGHYSAGEGIDGGLREIQEEVGLRVRADELLLVARRREEVLFPSGLIEREIQDVYFLGRDFELEDLSSDPSEVTHLALVPLPEFGDLAAGRCPSVTASAAEVVAGRRLNRRTIDLTVDDFVPRSRSYYSRVARFARQLAAGTAKVGRLRRW